jgi:hypothetical protein
MSTITDHHSLLVAGTPAEEAATERRPSVAPAWARELFGDRALWGVLLVWAFCWLAWAIYLDRFANALPWSDEYAFILSGVATGENPLSWDFLWTPANEHRAPLTRLWAVGLGRAFNWDFRRMLQADLALMAGGCLALVLAARAVRGRSHLCDAFLPLVILTSAQYETLAYYVYAYAMALAVWCVMAAAVMAGWQTRSVPRLLLYLLGALVVTWAGGPAGNLWALGLCVPLAVGWFRPTGRPWKVSAVLGGLAVAGSSALLIYCVPPSPAAHLPFRSDSWLMTYKAAAKCSVGWLGGPALITLWPWALLVLVVPLLYLGVRFLGDVRRTRLVALVRWSDLGALLLSAAALVVVLGQARAKYPALWSSRYVAMEIPIAVVVYLMLVRCAAPKTLLASLAVGMAVCVGWNWPTPIEAAKVKRPRQIELNAGLREGRVPLTLLAERYPDAIGWSPECGLQHILGSWRRMREARISVFGRDAEGAQRCPLWDARAGTLAASAHVIEDARAVSGAAVEGDADAAADYEVTVPEDGTYKLCCRWLVPAPGHAFAVAVDGGPSQLQWVPVIPQYMAVVFVPPLTLTAGTHHLTVTWPGPGSRLDVLELNPE